MSSSLEMTEQNKDDSDSDSDNAAVDLPPRSKKGGTRKQPVPKDDSDSDSDSDNGANTKNKNKNKNKNKKQKKAATKEDSDSDDSPNDSDSDEEDAADEKKRKERARKRKERTERPTGRKRSRSSGPLSPGAEYRNFKIASLTLGVLLFITCVICIQWTCLYAHMCFVTEDPAVPQPQSNYIVPLIVAAFLLAPLGHLLNMSESGNLLFAYGLIVLGWAIFTFVLGMICFGNASEASALALAQNASDTSPFPKAVQELYYADINAIKVKMQFNLNSLGGCALAISLLQMFHAIECAVFGFALLRA